MACINLVLLSMMLLAELFSGSPTAAYAGNILCVPMVGEGSHYTVINTIAKEMVNRGHNITMLVASHYKEKLSRENGNDRFHFESFKPFTSQEYLHEVLKNMTNAGLKGKYIEWVMEMAGGEYDKNGLLECKTMLADKDLMSRVRNVKFDLAIVDHSYLCPVVQYLRKEIGLPFVAISPVLALPSAFCIGNRWPFNPSYMPEFASGYTDHMTSFSERLYNTGWTLFFTGLVSLFHNVYDELRTDFDIADTTNFYDDAEMFLINSHFSLDYPKPTLPNTVMVGGLTAKPMQTLNKVSIAKIVSI